MIISKSHGSISSCCSAPLRSTLLSCHLKSKSKSQSHKCRFSRSKTSCIWKKIFCLKSKTINAMSCDIRSLSSFYNVCRWLKVGVSMKKIEVFSSQKDGSVFMRSGLCRIYKIENGMNHSHWRYWGNVWAYDGTNLMVLCFSRISLPFSLLFHDPSHLPWAD